MRNLGRELIRFGGHQQAHWAALRAGVGIALPSALVIGTGHPELIGPVTFGAIPAIFARHATYRTRLVVQAGITAAMAVTVVVAGAVSLAQPSLLMVALVLAAVSGAGVVAGRRFGWAPVPSIFIVFAAGAMLNMGGDYGWDGILIFVLGVLASGAFAIGLGQIGRLLPPMPRTRHGHEPMPFRTMVRHRPVLEDLALYVPAPLLATLASGALGSQHLAWAAVAAVVPMSGLGFTPRVSRVVTRIVGTLFGVAATAAIMAFEPPTWAFVVVLTVAMLIAELFIARHYAIAVIGITQIALLGEVIATGPSEGMYVARITDTVLGVAIALVIVVAIETARRVRRRKRGR